MRRVVGWSVGILTVKCKNSPKINVSSGDLADAASAPRALHAPQGPVAFQRAESRFRKS
jgi:hypothetical protein